QRADLIGPHQAAVTDHVGGKHGAKSAFHTTDDPQLGASLAHCASLASPSLPQVECTFISHLRFRTCEIYCAVRYRTGLTRHPLLIPTGRAATPGLFFLSFRPQIEPHCPAAVPRAA